MNSVVEMEKCVFVSVIVGMIFFLLGLFVGANLVKNCVDVAMQNYEVTPIVKYEKPEVYEDPEDKVVREPEYDIVEMKVTAYCPSSCCCGEYADGKTSIGKDASTKGVAVDPRYIAYGTMIEIPQYGLAEADDCGSAIQGKRLDVRFPTHKAALNWGVKKLKVKIYRSPK